MGKFIGVKLVDAVEHEEAGIPGYEVTYKDGYKSWCPKEIFEENNLPLTSDDNKITEADVKNFIGKIYAQSIGEKTTLVQVELINGFVLNETSSCVDPANYDEQIGVNICMEKIKDTVWFLLGFLLQSGLSGFVGSDIKEDKIV